MIAKHATEKSSHWFYHLWVYVISKWAGFIYRKLLTPDNTSCLFLIIHRITYKQMYYLK